MESPSPSEEGAAPAPAAKKTRKPAAKKAPKARMETYEVLGAEGRFKVTRNIDTGEASYEAL